MTDFEVVYTYGANNDMILPSKVYAVDPKDNTFLIVDGWGKFHWASMDRCTEKTAWEVDHGKLCPDEEEKEPVEAPPEASTSDSLTDICKGHPNEHLVKLGEDFAKVLNKRMQDRRSRGLYG